MPLENRVEELIEELGTTAYRLAKDTGVSLKTIYALKNDKSLMPSAIVLGKICDTYQLDPGRVIKRKT